MAGNRRPEGRPRCRLGPCSGCQYGKWFFLISIWVSKYQVPRGTPIASPCLQSCDSQKWVKSGLCPACCHRQSHWILDPAMETCFSHEKISFGGIPNSRTDLFLQIFLKRAAKPSARNNSACSKASQALSGTFSGTLLNLTWLCTKASQTFSGTFSGTLLNLTWLCTKASQAFSGTFYGTRWNWYSFAPRTFSGTFSGTLLNLTWLCTKASNLRNLLRNLVEPDPAPALAHTGVILGWRPH